MLFLGVDTSNYATSLAVVDAHSQEVVCALKRFLPVQEGAKGMRQSDAVFHHTVALPAMAQQLKQHLPQNAIFSGIGVSISPRNLQGSYMPCFLAGQNFASAVALGADAPLVSCSHQQGHLAAALFSTKNEQLWSSPLIFFHASGGTTEIVLAEGYTVKQTLGQSLDLYAGQAIDRLGVALGYPFPAGEQVSLLAQNCTESVRPSSTIRGSNCHLSGLQNQCENLLNNHHSKEYVAKYCLLSIAEAMSGMLYNVCKQYKNLPIICAGGVFCSTTIRDVLTPRFKDILFAPAELSADNAVGVAAIAAKERG